MSIVQLKLPAYRLGTSTDGVRDAVVGCLPLLPNAVPASSLPSFLSFCPPPTLLAHSTTTDPGAAGRQDPAQDPGSNPADLTDRPFGPRHHPHHQVAGSSGRERSPAQAEPAAGCCTGRHLKALLFFSNPVAGGCSRQFVVLQPSTRVLGSCLLGVLWLLGKHADWQSLYLGQLGVPFPVLSSATAASVVFQQLRVCKNNLCVLLV